MELASVEGLSKRFGSRQVLQGVNFSVLPGEVLGLIGPNGSGKTTLLEVMSGLIPDDGGTVSFKSNSLKPAHRKNKLFYLPDGISRWGGQTVGWALKFFDQIYPGSLTGSSSLIAPVSR
jgi:ABC-2 type transport system ATP-binding protein